jgi:hypothetical protein
MATTIVKPVSGNASQAVANDDFEAYQREANKADLAERFGSRAEPEKVVEPEPKKKADEPEKRDKKPREMTYKELRERVRALETENVQLKTPKSEPKEVVEPEPKAEPEKLRARPKSDDVADGKAKYATWEQYEDDLLAWNQEKIFRELDERNAKLTQEQQIQTVNQTIEQSWKERVTKSREAHADFDEIALGEDGPGKLIQPGSLVDEWLMDSEYGAELLYYFGKNKSELLKFENVAGKTPTERRANARRALVKLEDKLTATEEKPKPEIVKDEPRVTKTPKPSSEVGGRGNSLPDPISAAIAGGSDADTGRYIEEMNRRELRQRFGDSRR